MKKNLISAVAAGLALALAITSFGCESGSNDPVAIQAATAYTDGLKFTYKALPTEYTWNGYDVTNARTVYKDGRIKVYASVSPINYVAGWTKNSYVNGVNAFNRKTGTILPEIEKKAQWTAPTLGNYCATKAQTIVLDAKAQTFTWKETTSTYQVVGLRLHSGNYGATERINEDGNDSLVYITLPFSIIRDEAPGTTGHTTDTAWGGTAATGYLNQYRASPLTNETELETLNRAEGLAGTNTITWNGAEYKLSELIDAYKRGARYFIEGNGKRIYYKTLTGDLNGEDDNTNTNFVKKYDAATEGSTDLGKGKYKLSGDYTSGTVTVVAWGDETFREDGFYYKANVLQINKADVDHPQATAYSVTNPKTGDRLFSANRTLNISGGVLTAPRFYEGYSSIATGTNYKNGFFLGKSLPTWARAKTFATDHTTREDTSYEGYSYSYIKEKE